VPGIFVSYCRETETAAKALAEDIEALGHRVWFDRDLSGGKAWWDEILAQIRACDLLVFVLSPDALNSTACAREWAYAADLGKPILPVLAADGVSTNLLPPQLSKIQFVDYRKGDRPAAIALARALAAVPPAKPLPEPLPEPPEAPISYLNDLAARIDSPASLAYEAQSALVSDLRRGVRDAATASDARTLLDRLRKRRDLFANIAEEIDDLRSQAAAPVVSRGSAMEKAKVAGAGVGTASGFAPHKPTLEGETGTPTAPRSLMAMKARLITSLAGAIAGLVVGIAGSAASGEPGVVLIALLFTVCGGAIAGAIAGARRQLIASALVGSAVGWFMFSQSAGFTPISRVVLGTSIGAVLGAIAGVVLLQVFRLFRQG
jgi:hypothetical protein